eukprot:TRINITY_DN14477_c0_g1_i1.p1 TRINITY_DN14477_c0_g1~~TRINITY_DN14477_c0_g1_i1.p1  ORF type:complete len:121 (+),score=17.53 TRINITY_DN14477_c0_g1_i1:242-604(+)
MEATPMMISTPMGNQGRDSSLLAPSFEDSFEPVSGDHVGTQPVSTSTNTPDPSLTRPSVITSIPSASPKSSSPASPGTKLSPGTRLQPIPMSLTSAPLAMLNIAKDRDALPLDDLSLIHI